MNQITSSISAFAQSLGATNNGAKEAFPSTEPKRRNAFVEALLGTGGSQNPESANFTLEAAKELEQSGQFSPDTEVVNVFRAEEERTATLLSEYRLAIAQLKQAAQKEIAEAFEMTSADSAANPQTDAPEIKPRVIWSLLLADTLTKLQDLFKLLRFNTTGDDWTQTKKHQLQKKSENPLS
jgi:hypothetical protein